MIEMRRTSIPNIFRTELDHPYNDSVTTCAYFARRVRANLFLYSYSRVEQYFPFLLANDGLEKICLTHRDEFDPSCLRLSNRFNSPILIHAEEAKVLGCSVENLITFDQDAELDNDFSVIWTPGHTAGSCCYKLRLGNVTILFTGDTIFQNRGKWSVAISDGNQEIMVRSLLKLGDVETDYWCPGLSVGEPCIERLSKAERDQIIHDCIERLKRGSTH